MRAFKLSFVLLVLCIVSVVVAQTSCPTIITTALETVDSACEATSRNQLCYGNITLNVTPREGATHLQFEQAGDLVDIADVASLQLSTFNLESAEWGVALMRIQANVPETLPGQNVTFLLFGDVRIRDAEGQTVELPVTARDGVNVRQRPSTSASVIASLSNGQEVIAVGRLADSSWIQVRLDNYSVGWVAADFLNGDLLALAPIEPNAPDFGPMQAFYFSTGITDRECAEAPDSGILIQTPVGVGVIELRANQVDIELGSTVYLQAQPGDAMYVYVIEGSAILTAHEQTQVVPVGTVSRVPLDADGAASGPPEYPQSYDFEQLQTLPVASSLLTPVEVSEAVAETRIDDAIAAIIGSGDNSPTQTVPVANSGDNTSSSSGRWQQNEVVTFNTCPGPLSVGSTNSWTPNIVFSADRQTFTYDGGPSNTTVTLVRAGDNVYTGMFGEITFTFTFTSPSTYLFLWEGIHGDPANGGCRFVMEGNATLVSGSGR